MEDEVGKLDLLCQECMTEHKRQRTDKEPMREAASSSIGGAKHTEEKGMDIDQIATEAWSERENVKCMGPD